MLNKARVYYKHRKRQSRGVQYKFKRCSITEASYKRLSNSLSRGAGSIFADSTSLARLNQLDKLKSEIPSASMKLPQTDLGTICSLRQVLHHLLEVSRKAISQHKL